MASVPALEMAAAMLKQAAQGGSSDTVSRPAGGPRPVAREIAATDRPRMDERPGRVETALRTDAARIAPPGLGQVIDLTV